MVLCKVINLQHVQITHITKVLTKVIMVKMVNHMVIKVNIQRITQMKVVLEKVTNLKLEVITLITKVLIKDTTVKMVNHMVIKENLMITQMKAALEKVISLKLEVIMHITKVPIKGITVKMVNHMVIKVNIQMIILKKIKLKIIDKMVLMAAVDKDMVDRKLVQHMLMKTVKLVNHFQKEEEPLKMQEKLLILKLLKNTKS